jgi:hypothetical protein
MGHSILTLIRAAEYVALFGGVLFFMALGTMLFEKRKQ